MILAINAVPADNVVAVDQQRQAIQLAKIELAVRVRESDTRLGRRLKSTAQSRSVAPIHAVRDDANPTMLAGLRLRPWARGVPAAIVDHDNLVVVRHLGQRFVRLADGLPNDVLFVIGRNHQRDARWLRFAPPEKATLFSVWQRESIVTSMRLLPQSSSGFRPVDGWSPCIRVPVLGTDRNSAAHHDTNAVARLQRFAGGTEGREGREGRERWQKG